MLDGADSLITCSHPPLLRAWPPPLRTLLLRLGATLVGGRLGSGEGRAKIQVAESAVDCSEALAPIRWEWLCLVFPEPSPILVTACWSGVDVQPIGEFHTENRFFRATGAGAANGESQAAYQTTGCLGEYRMSPRSAGSVNNSSTKNDCVGLDPSAPGLHAISAFVPSTESRSHLR